MAVTLLVGAMPYTIDDRAVEYLLEWMRALSPLDVAGRAVLDLADRIEANGGGVIELGYTEIEGLCAYVLRDYLVQGDDGLMGLLVALRRYRGDPDL